MASLTVNLTGSKKLTIDCSGADWLIDSPLISNLLSGVGSLHNSAPLKKVEWKRVGNPADLLFQYSFTLVDGRVWSQQINMTVPTNPLMGFNFPDTFRLNEFVAHRNLRDHILNMYREHSVYKIDIDW